MNEAFSPMRPQPAGQLLRAADDAAVVLVGCGIDDPQDLEHRIGKIRIPAAGPESDLSEQFARAEGAAEGPAPRDEPIEGALVPEWHQRIPNRLDPVNIAASDRVLHRREARFLFQSLVPS